MHYDIEEIKYEIQFKKFITIKHESNSLMKIYMAIHDINNLIFIEKIMNKTYYLNILKDHLLNTF